MKREVLIKVKGIQSMEGRDDAEEPVEAVLRVVGERLQQRRDGNGGGRFAAPAPAAGAGLQDDGEQVRALADADGEGEVVGADRLPVIAFPAVEDGFSVHVQRPEPVGPAAERKPAVIGGVDRGEQHGGADRLRAAVDVPVAFLVLRKGFGRGAAERLRNLAQRGERGPAVRVEGGLRGTEQRPLRGQLPGDELEPRRARELGAQAHDLVGKRGLLREERGGVGRLREQLLAGVEDVGGVAVEPGGAVDEALPDAAAAEADAPAEVADVRDGAAVDQARREVLGAERPGRGGTAARADGPLPLAGDLEAAVRRKMVVVRPAAEEDLAVGLAAHLDREGGAFALGSGPLPGEADLRGDLAPVAQRAAERLVRVGVHALFARHQDVVALGFVQQGNDRPFGGLDETDAVLRGEERGSDGEEEGGEDGVSVHGRVSFGRAVILPQRPRPRQPCVRAEIAVDPARRGLVALALFRAPGNGGPDDTT